MLRHSEHTTAKVLSVSKSFCRRTAYVNSRQISKYRTWLYSAKRCLQILRMFCGWAVFILALSSGTEGDYVNSFKYNVVEREVVDAPSLEIKWA